MKSSVNVYLKKVEVRYFRYFDNFLLKWNDSFAAFYPLSKKTSPHLNNTIFVGSSLKNKTLNESFRYLKPNINPYNSFSNKFELKFVSFF